MLVLGFDPSLTSFGWCLHDSNGVGTNRCVERGMFHSTSKTLFIDRYTEMREKVRLLIERMGATYGVVKLGQESPVFGESYSEGLYGLFLYTCEALRSSKVDVVFFSPGQGKAHASAFLRRPKGWKMGKPDMVEAAKADCGGKGTWNHNEADAYWIARSAARFWQFHDRSLKPESLTPAELKQFTEIHTYQRGKHAGETVEKGLLYRENERFFCWSTEE